MARLDPAVVAVRRAVRAGLADPGVDPAAALLVACSGGADSLALAAGVAAVAARSGRWLGAVVVDHGLQPGSAGQAADAVELLEKIGLPAEVRTVRVEGGGGPEAAARRARYAALRAARPTPDALVLLGHTRDDQAETVLLGLGRGSGPRSIAGMRRLDPPWLRPLLDLPRATTRAVCAALGLPAWEDPHNADPRFVRARLRHEVLPLLEDVLSGGVAGALARTAEQLREDADVLDELAAALAAAATADGELDAAELARAPAALRRRALRMWLTECGVSGLTDARLRTADDLIGRWRGQGPLALPGGLELLRSRGRLMLRGQRPTGIS
jgi:tRNA(Ile)-lysidine synthase